MFIYLLIYKEALRVYVMGIFVAGQISATLLSSVVSLKQLKNKPDHPNH